MQAESKLSFGSESVISMDDDPYEMQENQISHEGIERRPKLSQAELEKLHKTTIEYQKQSRKFKQPQDNRFRLEDPLRDELLYISNAWDRRLHRNPQFISTLQLERCLIPVQQVIQMFSLYPSIKVIYNGLPLKTTGVLKVLNEIVYEGTERKMTIFKTLDDEIYTGNVIKQQTISTLENVSRQQDIYLPHGKGIFMYRNKKDGFFYQGDFVMGKRQGKGYLRTSRHLQYKGQFKNDFKHGYGEECIKKRKKDAQNRPTGEIKVKSTYIGEFAEGQRSGEGIQITSHYKYEGSWANNAKSGKGKVVFTNGDSYEGDWENNEFSGTGEKVQKGVCTYKGQFKAGRYEGSGVMQYTNGDSYEGQFKNGKKHGKGVYKWKDEDYYDGEWISDSANGSGTAYLNENFYEGEFKNGLKHGQIMWTNPEGQCIRSIWLEDKQIKRIEVNGEPFEEEEK